MNFSDSPMDRLEILWAIEEIKQLKARYFRFTDTRRTDDFMNVFTPDLMWTWLDRDNTTVLTQFTSAQAFRDYLDSIEESRMAGFSVHQGFLPEIEILDADSARGIWAMQDYIHNPGDKHFIGYGHYHEEYRRCPDGQWRISHCTVSRLHVDPFPDDPTHQVYTGTLNAHEPRLVVDES